MRSIVLGLLLVLSTTPVDAADAPKAAEPVADPTLAKQLGADERGMRHYILAILKTGPKRMPDGKARDEMFAGHFANITRLADAGKLAVAGPFGDKTDWRGMFVFAVQTPEEAAELVATDPVIASGEMVAEYHRLYASAALMSVYATHLRIAPK